MSLQQIDREQAWFGRVLGVQLDAAPGAVLRAALDSRLAEAVARLRSVDAIPDFAEAPRLVELALGRGDFGSASSELGKMEAAIARARSLEAAREIGNAAKSKTIGVVAFAKVCLRWAAARNAHRVALDNVRAACAAVLSDPEAGDDPQFEEMKAAAAEVADILPAPPEEIDDEIDAMSTSDADRQMAARTNALAAIRSYRNLLDSEPALRLLQDLPTGAFPIYDKVIPALDALETALAG